MSSKSNILDDMRDMMRWRRHNQPARFPICKRCCISPPSLSQNYHIPACCSECSLLLHCGYNFSTGIFRGYLKREHCNEVNRKWRVVNRFHCHRRQRKAPPVTGITIWKFRHAVCEWPWSPQWAWAERVWSSPIRSGWELRWDQTGPDLPGQ